MKEENKDLIDLNKEELGEYLEDIFASRENLSPEERFARSMERRSQGSDSETSGADQKSSDDGQKTSGDAKSSRKILRASAKENEKVKNKDNKLNAAPDKSPENGETVKNQDPKKQNTKKDTLTGKDFLEMLIYFVIVLVATFCIIRFVGQRTIVEGSSMEPTLSSGDNLIVEKLSYRFSDPERFDIIVFPYQYSDNTNYIKRIIGLPGETVQIDYEGNIYIDGELLEEDYGLETIDDPGLAADPITLGDDEYFVLGDNRNHSSDSRMSDVYLVKRDDIIGRAWIRIYPFNQLAIINHSFHGE